nr:hypothetical protein [Jiangella sp. DSM 45060]
MTSPIGTLMKNTHSHPSSDVMTPPISSPAVAPNPPRPPHTPSARLRSAPSGKVATTIDSAVGAMIAADTPCTARAATSTSPDHARPQNSDDATKSTSPAMNTRRRPNRSAIRPENSISPAKVSA